MPWDVFVKAQLAGDLLDEPERTRALGGLGFLGGGPWYYDLANPRWRAPTNGTTAST